MKLQAAGMSAATTFVAAEDARTAAKPEVAEASIRAEPDVAPSTRSTRSCAPAPSRDGYTSKVLPFGGSSSFAFAA